ncbi:MAG: hypothetical protein M3280_09845 [Actinomycetota bacterium]|nr:hypothetical protein [Actinomycetota bacterium]
MKAAELWAGEGAAVSHRSAALLWGLDGVQGAPLDLTMSLGRNMKGPGVKTYRSKRLPECDITFHRGFRITTPARTIVDLASVMQPGSFELALEDALRKGLTSVRRLQWRYEELCGPGRKGCGLVRQFLDEFRSETSTESGLEVKVERLLVRGRLPRPVRQYEIFSARRSIARPDLAYPSALIAIEAHSFRHHSGRSAWYRDIERDRELRKLGWLVIYVTDEDLRNRPDEVIDEVRNALLARAPELL